MEKQEAAGAAEVGGAGCGGGGLQGTVSGFLDGAAAGLRVVGSSLHGAGLSPRPISSSADERPRGILKNSSSILVPRVPCGEKKKSPHWDEVTILATYHPLGKDYALMKVDDPSAPCHRLEDSDEDLRAGTSQAVTPGELAERLTSLDSFCPKVLQFGDNKNTGSKDKLTSKKMQKDFEWHRKAHYDEGKYLKAQKLAAQDDEEEPPHTPDGGSHALPQPPPDREFDRRRKEYYSKGTYLKVAIPTDSEEDTDKEQKDGTSGLTWVIEKPLTSQGIHLLGLAGQAPNGEQKSATEKPLTITVTQSQPGTTLTQKHNGSPVMSGWCHWLVTKELSWKSTGIPDKDAGESQGAPGGPERRPPKMTVKLDFEECLKDSPRFRASIELVESDISELENRLEKLLKLGSSLLESGRHYLASCRAFISGIQELSNLGPPEPMMIECLDKFTESLSHKINCHEDLLNATQQTLKQQIQSFVKESLRGFWEARREFWRGAESLEAALSHNAEVPRRRAHEAEEAMSALKAVRAGYQGRALDYVLQINVIQDKRKFDIMEFVLRLVEAQAIYFQLGHEELNGLGVYHKELGAQLHKLVLESAREKRDMEQRHVLLKEQELSGEEPEPGLKEGPGGLVMEGHLFKRASNAFKTWSRRWFTIQNNQLVYQKKYKDPMTVVVDDLRLCTVKLCPDSERRFCFEVVSPSKSCLLQADSEQLLQLWVSAVQSSIATAFSQAQEERGSLDQGPSHSASGLPSTLASGGASRGTGRGTGVAGRVAAQVQSVEGNAQCCDCREPAPEWASINLGVTLCIQCSGIHRSLGVHFSKVRSLTLDSWEPELVKLMCELGNVVINQIYEARIQEMSVKKPGPTCSRQEKEAWIHAKYVEKKFLTKLPVVRGRKVGRGHPRGQPPLPPKPQLPPRPGNMGAKPALPSGELGCLHPGALLFWAAGPPPSLPTMADALAHGADVNWVNGARENATPLIQATSTNSLLACEFLLQNGANVNQADSMGRSPLHHATILGHTGLACLFLKRGADLGAQDSEGKDPLTIAMETANADIVTLLRLAKMREAEVAQGQAGDETYLDIFRDFSLMASDDPEKLSRRSHDLHTL